MGPVVVLVVFPRAVQEAAVNAAAVVVQAPAEEGVVCAVVAQRLATLMAVGHIHSSVRIARK